MLSRTYAAHKHASLEQKYGEDEYVVHLDEVKAVVERFGYSSVAIASFHDLIGDATYLHDIIEDTNETEESLAETFHIYVAQAVQNLSDVEAYNRKTRKALTNQKFAKYSVDIIPELMALIIKPADRFANMSRALLEKSSMMKAYYREYPDFKEAAYREGVVDELWEALDELMLEYEKHLNIKK